MILLQQDYDKLQIQVLYHCLLQISIFCCIYCCKNIGVTNNRRTLIAITKRLMKKKEQASNFFVFSQMSTFNNLLKMHKL